MVKMLGAYIKSSHRRKGEKQINIKTELMELRKKNKTESKEKIEKQNKKKERNRKEKERSIIN